MKSFAVLILFALAFSSASSSAQGTASPGSPAPGPRALPLDPKAPLPPVSSGSASQGSDRAQVIATLNVPQFLDPMCNVYHKATVDFPTDEKSEKELEINFAGNTNLQSALLAIPQEMLPKVTAGRFGFSGEIKCDHIVTLEMALGFVERLEPAPKYQEPHTEVLPSTSWQHFDIQFDRGHSGLTLEHLRLWADLWGPIKLQLRNLKLVQYPDQPQATTGQVAASESEIPSGQSVAEMPWNFVPPMLPGVYCELHNVGDANDLKNYITLSYEGSDPIDEPVRNYPLSGFTDAPPVSTHHYAIVGEVMYQNVAAGSYLEMWSHFVSSTPGAPDQAFFTRTLAPNGPLGNLEGTHDWRDFWLPFDSTETNAKLIKLDFNLHLAGPGTVSFQGLRLVQYEDGLAQILKTVSSTPIVQSGVAALKLTWFCFGIIATLFTAAASYAAVRLFRMVRARQHVNELRRIASLDS